MKVGIIGLGLMGGSFALALKRKFKQRDERLEIIGIDHNDQHCIEALELKITDKITDDITDLLELDLIVLTIPVNGILKILPELKNASDKTTIIDFGSTKEKIVQAIPQEIRKNFVAAHPMAGTEKSGPTAADRKLYRGKVVVLCNTEDNDPKHLKFAKNVFRDIGMKIFYMNAKEHDKHAAYISHMPHAVSYALSNSVMKQENPKAVLALAGGGFKDMSRIAKSAPAMWIDIFKQNKTNLLSATKSLKKEIETFENLVENEEWEELSKWILKANELHNIL